MMINKSDKLQHWLLYTPIGRYILRNERVFYHNLVKNIFGYYSLQIGLPQINFLQGNKIANHYIIGSDIQTDIRFLSIASSSIDLIICPHILEFTDNYHHFLQECYRILIPNGKLIITAFNSKSLFKLFNYKDNLLKELDFISLDKLKNQLHTLNFQISAGKFFCYRPPIQNIKYLEKLSWMDKAGDRWLPTFANSYGIVACKEVVTPTFISPNTKQVRVDYTPQLETTKICKK